MFRFEAAVRFLVFCAWETISSAACKAVVTPSTSVSASRSSNSSSIGLNQHVTRPDLLPRLNFTVFEAIEQHELFVATLAQEHRPVRGRLKNRASRGH